MYSIDMRWNGLVWTFFLVLDDHHVHFISNLPPGLSLDVKNAEGLQRLRTTNKRKYNTNLLFNYT